jgi:hypothetical protein
LRAAVCGAFLPVAGECPGQSPGQRAALRDGGGLRAAFLYLPEVLKANEAPAWNVALKFRREAFSVTLFRALKEDSDAQARASGEIAGLDFDPFLNTQDPCDRYRVGAVASQGAGFRVAIYGMCSGRRDERPVVIAEVERQRGSWVFADFLYPTIRTDLLRTLKALKAERQKAKHSH